MQKHRYLLLVILCSLLPFLYFFFTPLLYHTHDGSVHLPRIAAYVKALRDFHIPVRWAGDLNYGYGLPLFNFMYPLPYFIASLFVLLGASLVMSFKLALFVSYLLSGVFMYLFSKAFFKEEKKAFIATLFYQFATFRFVELLVRGSLGEVYTYTFLPLVLLGITILWQKKSLFGFFLTAIATCFLILSHNAISLVFFGVCCLFVLFFLQKRKELLLVATALLWGIALAAFYWIPAILEHKYTYGNLFMKELYNEHFAPFFQFFIPNMTNAVALRTGGIAVQVGLLHCIGIGVGVYYLLKKKTGIFEKKVYLYSLILLLVAFFFMQPVSRFLWERIALLRQFQFPWRFLAVVVFASSLLATSLLHLQLFKKTKWYIVLVVVVIGISGWYWRPSLGLDTVSEQQSWDFPLNTTYYGETDLIWSAGPAKAYPKQRIEVIGGIATVSGFMKKTQEHTYTVEVTKEATLVDHTQYYPGWKVFVDGVSVPIQFQDPNSRGEITFRVPNGAHAIHVVFGENTLRKIADTLSLIASASLLIIVFIKRKSFL